MGDGKVADHQKDQSSMPQHSQCESACVEHECFKEDDLMSDKGSEKDPSKRPLKQSPETLEPENCEQCSHEPPTPKPSGANSKVETCNPASTSRHHAEEPQPDDEGRTGGRVKELRRVSACVMEAGAVINTTARDPRGPQGQGRRQHDHRHREGGEPNFGPCSMRRAFPGRHT